MHVYVKRTKLLSCNLFCNYFVSLSPHITLIVATSTFLSAGRKSSQTTALYSSACEYYVQIASPRVCGGGVHSLPMCESDGLASHLDLAPKWERPYSRGMSWVRLKSPFVIIHAVDLRLRGRHRRSVFGFSAASNRLFFFIWPLGLNRVCLDSAKCSIYFSC